MRIYVDSNVFGDYPASAWQQARAANTLFARIRNLDYLLVTSKVVEGELLFAPVAIRDLFTELTIMAEWVVETPEAYYLAQAYVTAGVVTKKHYTDALHVALATVAGCDVLTSWNNRDYSNKVANYSAVSIQFGYAPINMYTPDVVLQEYSQER